MLGKTLRYVTKYFQSGNNIQKNFKLLLSLQLSLPSIMFSSLRFANSAPFAECKFVQSLLLSEINNSFENFQ